MNRLRTLAILPIILSGMLVTGEPTAAGALVGTVCPNIVGSTGCPATSFIFPGQAVGSSLSVAINIAGSDALSGASVSVQTDPTVFSPTSISTTGTVIPSPTLTLVNCVNGVPQGGASCNPYDTVGVASIGILSLGGATLPPTTGLIFTITYTVKSVASTSISFLVNPGCANQSVAGTNTCVLITNGPAVIPETFLTGICLCGEPPTITGPITATGTAGTPLSFAVMGSDANPAETVTLTASGLPSGATFTTSGTNPATGTFVWTASNGQMSATVTFTAKDNEGTPQTATLVTQVNISPTAPKLGIHEAAHHLNLAKVACKCQTFTITVTSSNVGTIYVQVSIASIEVPGFSATTAVTAVSGITSVVITLPTGDLTANIGVKQHWTATLTWGITPTSLPNTGANTKSGAFAVV